MRGRREARAWLRAAKLIRQGELMRYARDNGSGAPLFCTPPLAVREDRQSRGLKPLKRKVIFNSMKDARDYAQFVQGWTGAASRAYPCPFSRHGHAHLTRNLSEER